VRKVSTFTTRVLKHAFSCQKSDHVGGKIYIYTTVLLGENVSGFEQYDSVENKIIIPQWGRDTNNLHILISLNQGYL